VAQRGLHRSVLCGTGLPDVSRVSRVSRRWLCRRTTRLCRRTRGLRRGQSSGRLYRGASPHLAIV
jgi:hypothetical protein